MPSPAWRRAALLLALCWAALIWFLSGRSGTNLPLLFPLQDKLLHLGAFAVLGALGMASRPLPQPQRHRREVLRVSLLAGTYGLIDEIHQYFVPGRNSDPLDVVADCTGAVLGAACMLWLLRRRYPAGSARDNGSAAA